MHPVVTNLVRLLEEASSKEVLLGDALINDFGEKCKQIVRRHFEEPKEKQFRIRASNIGRPLCQLQMEQKGVEGEAHRAIYANKMSSMYGDLIEALLVLLIKASGTPVLAEQKKVSLDLDGHLIEGTLDLYLQLGNQSGIYDIKSCSSWAYANKFGPTCSFNDVMKDDDFGYVKQGFFYSQAEEEPFAGWIAFNKETGEVNVLETPLAGGYIQQEAIEDAKEKVKALMANKPFERCFDLVEETFNRKKTGNRYLGHTCTWCPFKRECWGELTYAPVPMSKAMSPPYRYYYGKIYDGLIEGKEALPEIKENENEKL